jgi:hypothetical protein
MKRKGGAAILPAFALRATAWQAAPLRVPADRLLPTQLTSVTYLTHLTHSTHLTYLMNSISR